MRNEDLLRATEEELIAEYEKVIGPHAGLAASTLLSALQRLGTLKLLSTTEKLNVAVDSLHSSSKRIERLTIALIFLTVLLLLAAIPPAAEIVARWLRRAA